MSHLFLVGYILTLSFLLIFCLPQQTRLRDKVTRKVYETRLFAQYKTAKIITKCILWGLLVNICLFFAGIFIWGIYYTPYKNYINIIKKLLEVHF